jgi:endoglucanase
VNIIGYDPIWHERDEGRFSDAHFRLIRDGGFSSVRINLHPFRHMGPADEYRLEESWLGVLDWAVEEALEQDLMVILDLHEFNAMADDPEGKKDMFLAFWRQIAPRFKDAPSTVLFEVLNEPSRGVSPEMWNGYLREALAVIRESNPHRTLIIGPARWNGIGALAELDLPDDDRDIIVTVHYYSPMEFTHQGAPWAEAYRDTLGVRWTGTPDEMGRIRSDFEHAQQWSLARDRPIFLGEFGAYDKGDMDSRARYTAAVARTAEEFGWSWAYWQFDSDFIVYDIDNDRWVEPIHDALVPRGE